jgi:hypothetical protein
VLTGVISCGKEEPTLGPCTVEAEAPLFTITRAHSTRDGAPIHRVVVREVVFRGFPLPLELLLNEGGYSPQNVTLVGGEMVCDIACNFGSTGGPYTIRFGAEGFRDTTLVLPDVQYSRARGPGCPTLLSGGITLSIGLEPSS